MSSNAKALFDLTPTEEQQMTRDVMQRFASDVMATAARDADEAAALPEGFLQKTVDLGLSFMPIPEAMGGAGAGRSQVSNALTFEDLARGDMSLAIAALTPLSVINCILDYGAEEQQEQVCSTLADVDFVPAALALAEPGIGFNPAKLTTQATPKATSNGDDGFSLSGEKCMVAYGADAKFIVVFAECEGAITGFVLNAGLEGIHFEPEDYMGLRPLPLFKMILDEVSVPASSKLSERFDLNQMLNHSRIANAALAVGTCQAVLDYVVPYVNERVAFGEPISNRQSVAFMADIAIELEGMRMMLYRAAAQAERGEDCTRLAYLTLRNAVKYGMKIGTDGVQLLGGHGFTREYPVELWYRNLRALPMLHGMLLA